MMDSTYFGQAWIGGNDGVRVTNTKQILIAECSLYKVQLILVCFIEFLKCVTHTKCIQLFVFCLFLQTFDWFWSDGSEFVVQRWFTPAPVKIGRWWKCLKVNRSGIVNKSTDSRQKIED